MTLRGHKPGEPLTERFWAKVDKGGPVHPVLDTECWLWTGGVTDAGYGRIALTRSRKTVGVHRLAWFLETGIWPRLHICHHCDNPACVRFDHLFQGTSADNTRDCAEKGRFVAIPVRRGEKNPSSKLTQQNVDEIRASATPSRTLALRFGVSKQTINNVRARRTWAIDTDV